MPARRLPSRQAGRAVALRRLRDVRRDECSVRSHTASAHAERRRVLARPVEPAGASSDVRSARPSIMADRLRGLRTGLHADPREHASLQPVLGPPVDGGAPPIADKERAGTSSSRRVPKHGEALDRLASRPQAELLQAVSRKVRPTDPYRVLHKRHGQRFRFGGTPRAPACFA
jgi:hypothetical protein